MPAPKNLDHVIVATTDLPLAVKEFAAATGVTPQLGGVHPNTHTRNYLVSFGGDAYLEIIGPDPDSGSDGLPTVFGIDRLEAARVATFAVHPPEPEAAILSARSLGNDLGDLGDGSRRDPEGNLLEWRLTQPLASEPSGVIPFVIDWGSTPSPAYTVQARAELTELLVKHPDPDYLTQRYAALGTDLAIQPDPAPAVHVTITGPGGSWSL